ncbi:glycoside hydrolase family 13 protein [Cohnella sp. 56]|uniref:glycoside hydrolase family 13 protein n=1 Tax=Cohnella sp. 56 TaxID=3113722 RepID=UPI0030E82E18
MLKEAIYHCNDIPYLFKVGEHEVKLRIRAKRGDVSECSVVHSDRYRPPGAGDMLKLTLAASTELHDYFEGVVYAKVKRLRYQFLLTGYDGAEVWCGEYGASESRRAAGAFHCASLAAQDDGAPPSWVKDAVVYQIFPDRFARSGASGEGAATEAWTATAAPTRHSVYGGNLKGVIDKLPYLQHLGINVLYFTPVFESPSNHKYDTTDYYKIDPAFGTLEELKALVADAHARGIRVVLDAVFNHSGDGFFAFRDVLTQGAASPYADWFHVRSYPVVQSPEPSYESFGIHSPSMPKLNTRHPDAAQYLLDVAAYWIEEAGIDGWRLDVANEVDHEFWRRLRRRVKGLGAELLLVGEIMHQSGAWLRGDQFDGVMNYLWRDAMVDFFARQTTTARAFAGQIESVRMLYTDSANSAMFNLLGSHDTERFLTACSHSGWGWQEKQETARLKLAVLFQMTYIGMPMIYYGDEVGMTGGEDPDCRRPMIWDERRQDQSLLSHYRTLIALRRDNPALTDGSFDIWFVDEAANTLGYVRRCGRQCLAVLINNSPNIVKTEPNLRKLPGVRTGEPLFGAGSCEWREDAAAFTLPAYGGLIIRFDP